MSDENRKKSRETRRISKLMAMYELDKGQSMVLEKLLDGISHGYTRRIQAKCLESGLMVTTQTIRHIKNGNTKNWKVLNYLIEDAKHYLKTTDQVKDSINSIQASL